MTKAMYLYTSGYVNDITDPNDQEVEAIPWASRSVAFATQYGWSNHREGKLAMMNHRGKITVFWHSEFGSKVWVLHPGTDAWRDVKRLL